MPHWLERRLATELGPRDGEATELERLADTGTGLAPHPSRPPQQPAPDPEQVRRSVIEGALATKVLWAHLQNRFQISFPLIVNLKNHTREEADLLMRVAATALTSAAEPSSRARTAEMLASVGATPSDLGQLEGALAEPPAISVLMSQVAAAGLAAHAYAIALLVLPRPTPSEEAFLNYLATRLALGKEVVIGLNRRYRS